MIVEILLSILGIYICYIIYEHDMQEIDKILKRDAESEQLSKIYFYDDTQL